MLGYLTSVIQALHLSVDQKRVAENLGCEREPPASPIPAELRTSCGYTSGAGSRPRSATGWEPSATGAFQLCTAQFARYPCQDARAHLPSFTCTQPLAHSSLCAAHARHWATQPKSPVSTVCAGGSAYMKEITRPTATFRLHLIKINHSNLSI